MIRVVDFRTEYRVGKDPVDWVLLAPIGSGYERTRTWHRVNSVRPPKDIDARAESSERYKDICAKWSVIKPAFDAWKGGQEAPLEGTPLAAWPGVTADQANFLRAMAVRTVEDVRDMGDSALSQLRWPNARQLPSLAAKYLESEDAATKDAKMAEMQSRMEAMEQLLIEASDAPKAEKPRRGRPPKKQSEPVE